MRELVKKLHKRHDHGNIDGFGFIINPPVRETESERERERESAILYKT